MDLRTSENFWPLKNGLLQTVPSLSHSLKCDVAIMGGGITGAIMADKLCKLGFEVIVLEKRHIGFGSTSASTALLQYENDVPLKDLIKKRGVNHAVQSYRLCVQSIKNLQKICLPYPEINFHLRPSFQFASYQSHVKDHQKEEELRRIYNIAQTQWLDSSDIKKMYGFNKLGGIYSLEGATIDPYQLTHKLLGAHLKRGLKVFDNTEVKDITHTKAEVILTCENKEKITAKKLVIACGYESQKYLPKQVEIPSTTYACASEIIDKKLFWPKQSLIWETSDPYIYLRTTQEGRIIIGGKDDPNHNPKKRDQKLFQKIKLLENNFKELFPHIPFKVDFSWAGFFCKTKDGLPYIGPIPERKNTYFALGFGGNGITYSQIASDIIADMICGKSNENIEIFSFNR